MKSSKPFAIVGAPNRTWAGARMTSLDLQAAAARAGCATRAWRSSDVDGVFARRRQPRRPRSWPNTSIRPRYVDSTSVGGMSNVMHAPRDGGASAACPTSCTCATRWRRSRRACARWRWWPTAAPSCRTARARSAARRGHAHAARAIHHPYGQLSPIGYYAMVAQLHMQRYGTTHRDLAEVAVAARRWAQLNPHAYRREDTSIDEVMASRLIADPLRQRDCCLVTDAGGAFILTTAERARSAPPAGARAGHRRVLFASLHAVQYFRLARHQRGGDGGRRWRWPASRARTSTWCRSMTTSPSA